VAQFFEVRLEKQAPPAAIYKGFVKIGTGTAQGILLAQNTLPASFFVILF
jgi:hypothetical protein